MPEKEYIEKKTLSKEISSLTITVGGKLIFNDDAKSSVLRVIDEHPTADVQEVRHGKWIINSDGYYPYCSECGKEPKEMSEFCPHCGAKMDKES